MPDRQRHSSLSDTLSRLFAARFRPSRTPAPAGRRRAGGPAGPRSAGPRGSQQGPAAGPGDPAWPDDPTAVTMELSRSPRDFLDPQHLKADGPDPMADTMMLGRLVIPEPAPAPPAPGFPAPGFPAPDLPASGFPAPSSGPDTATNTAGSDIDAAAEAAANAAADADADADASAKWTWPPQIPPIRDLLLRHRRQLAIAAAGVAALAVLLALPPVRTQLRDSFTQVPRSYTALYFTSPPQVDGTVLTVPVSVHAVNSGGTAYSVRVWTVDAKGQADDSQTAGLKWDGQALSAVVSMPVNPAAVYVWVSLGGSTETLHYKIAVS